MRPLRVWLVYLTVVFGGGALLAPWLYWLVEALGDRFGIFRDLAEHPFHRFVNRSLLVLALAGVWPVVRLLGIRSWSEIGWASPTGQWRRLGLGFGLGFVSLAVIVLIAWWAGAREVRGELTVADVASHLIEAGLAASVVSLIEETLFRGALFGTFRRSYGFAPALAFSSAAYALVHFFARVRWDASIEWHTGFAVLGRMSEGFLEFTTLTPGFFNLALAGALLAWAYERTGNLYFSVGLHAGWIFWIKSYGFLFQPTPGVGIWFWGTGKLTDGWLALSVLSLVALSLSRLRVGLRMATQAHGEDA